MDDSEGNSTPDSTSLSNATKKLHDICNWDQIEDIAIEYHDLEQVICISYRELLPAKSIVSDCLECIKGFEFIGINFDVPEYCVVSLMLGILTSGHSFVNIPPDLTENTNLKNSLCICYWFCQQIGVEGEIIKQLTIHSKHLYLIKLNTEKRTVQNVKQNYYAYAISTSGSTGAPKVVKVLHSCIVPNILDLVRILTITRCDKVAQFTSFTFDPCIIEIFIALSTGSTLVMVSKTLKNNANRLLEETHSSQVTVLQMTPSIFLYSWSTERLNATILGNSSSLRVLLLGGEPFPKIESVLETKHPHNSTKMYNIYGITEVSCWASINEIVTTNKQFDSRYLGQALSETMFEARDETGKVIKNGTGFLHIGSNTRVCTINNENIEDLTFPVWRDSGDIVDVDEEGRIFYRGRKNGIIKRFGNKVDLTKLEQFALQENFVKNCYALWDESNHKLHLCLATKEKVTDYTYLKIDMMKHLHELQPLYRPDKIHFLEHFEFTSSGKISVEFLKNYIQEKTISKTSQNIELQRIKEIVISTWKEHFRDEKDGFVKLGGTSVIALQISNTMTEALNVEFPELIGMLLKDAALSECLNYIKNTVLCNHKSSTMDDHECRSNDNRTIPLIPKSAHDNILPKYSDINDQVLYKNYVYQWHKCRGQTYGDPTIVNENLKQKLVSKIEVLKTYDLQKCVDASPTVFQYSDGKMYAAVGSHSGFISTFQLEKESSTSVFRIKLPDRIEASILILDDFTGIVGCYDGNVYCLNLKTGNVIWKHQTGDVVKCTAILCEHRNKIFVGSYDCFIYCLSVKDGAEIWRIKGSSGSITASGCLHRSSFSVLFGTLDGTCLALDQISGKIIWKHKLADPIFIAPVMLNNGLVLFCSVTGTLVCFDIEVNVEMWKYRINGNVFSYIVKQNNSITNRENIILASQNKCVYCIQGEDSNFKTEPIVNCVLNLRSSIFATPWCEESSLFVMCTDGTLNIYNFVENRLVKVEKLPGDVFSSPVVHDDLVIVGCRDNNVYVLKMI